MRYLVIILLLIAVNTVYAGDGNWEANLNISISNVDSRLSFGQRQDAGDGVDGMYDVPAMLGGDLKACFILDGSPYWSDIKGVGKKVWRLMIKSPLEGNVTIRWQAEALPPDITATLIDTAAGASLDMKASNRYSYRNSGLRVLTIEIIP